MDQEPILKEIRRIRHEIEEECHNDAQKYYEHIQELQRKYSNRLARFNPKAALKLAKSK
jgi:Ni2+-binding GTPase involved in maturation of urease and hydrogenase